MSDYDDFVTGDAFEYLLPLHEGPPVRVTADKVVTVTATWGGWVWRAEGQDRSTALRRLETRLNGRNPFHGADTDWGNPGSLAHGEGDLDEAIPTPTRKLMVEFDARSDELPYGCWRMAYGPTAVTT